jgi:hypothetical protein
MPADDRVHPVVVQRVVVQGDRVQRQHCRGDADVAQPVGGGIGHRDRGRVIRRHPDDQ